MLFTLCQRLVESDKIGFEYDYMGAAEYEFGATRKARQELDNADTLVRAACTVKTHSKTFECTAIFPKDYDQQAQSLLALLATDSYHNKGAMAYPSRDPLGWLVLDPVPMLIHIRGKDGEQRAAKFLEHGRQLFSKS